MRADRPSLTAAVVSFARGVVSTGPGAPCFDPVAIELLPPPFTQLLWLLDRAGERRRWLEPVVKGVMGGLVEHIELRTALIDAALRAAVGSGVRQLVILGAGLDGRAWRMAELADVTVYEVDHPATQAWKMNRVRGRTPMAKEVHFVPVDFEQTSLDDALARTGHDPNAPTFWIWEGVTPYLNEAAIDGTLRIVADRSAKKSGLVLTYVTPDMLDAHRLRRLAGVVFHAIREPLRGALSREAMTRKLSSFGFHVMSDELPAEAARRYGRSTRRRWASPSERVIVAEK
ncbi:MAG: class I SAM-dependent methyltransferase [Myxococcaceae bacterium]|nr:class I SAM-dependent methyltransferase [Myxococcaceae bacterium]